jgi:hypothetical protein
MTFHVRPLNSRWESVREVDTRIVAPLFEADLCEESRQVGRCEYSLHYPRHLSEMVFMDTLVSLVSVTISRDSVEKSSL